MDSVTRKLCVLSTYDPLSHSLTFPIPLVHFQSHVAVKLWIQSLQKLVRVFCCAVSVRVPCLCRLGFLHFRQLITRRLSYWFLEDLLHQQAIHNTWETERGDQLE